MISSHNVSGECLKMTNIWTYFSIKFTFKNVYVHNEYFKINKYSKFLKASDVPNYYNLSFYQIPWPQLCLIPSIMQCAYPYYFSTENHIISSSSRLFFFLLTFSEGCLFWFLKDSIHLLINIQGIFFFKSTLCLFHTSLPMFSLFHLSSSWYFS